MLQRHDAAPAGVAIRAPAKINLALHVTGRRDDGYHELQTLVVFAEFGDRVTVTPSEADDFRIEGPFSAGLDRGTANLVIRARDGLRARLGEPAFPVAIVLEKNLPVASGIGGGSTDAAAALLAFASLWGGGRATRKTVEECARELGADVPMCLAARPLLAIGIGHETDMLADFPELFLVLANPGVAVSTAEIFRTLARRDNSGLPPLPAETSRASLPAWLRTTRNDLQPAAEAIAPAIGDALSALDGEGAELSRMSGSGATCFGIFPDALAASTAARRIVAARPDWFVRATRTVAREEGI